MAGSGAIAAAGNALTVTQSSSHAIINWQNFSIGQGNSVNINNGAGATLNRVITNAPSTIAGSLTSTGSTYLINQNGIIVTPSGSVVTGGSFVGSTRDISNNDFLQGRARFTGSSAGTVVNQGKITSANGDAVLVGKSVTNSGHISGPKGTAALLAGDDVVLQPASGGLQIKVKTGSGDVSNTGTVAAAQAVLNAAGGNVYALAGNNGGVVRATGTTTINGHVWLTAGGSANVAGTVAASNADGSGGTITVRAPNIDIKGVLDASATLPRAAGGAVSVIATGNTAVTGTIRARPGAGGQGGIIETSGKYLSIGGASVDAGTGGQWLLDPVDLIVDSSAASTISSTLGAGTNVSLVTDGVGATGFGTQAAGNGDIFINSAISWNSGATLSLSAWRNIDINANINISGAGALSLATGTGTTGDLLFGGGHVDFGATPNGGSLNINGAGYTLLYDMVSVQSIGIVLPSKFALATSLNATNPWTPISSFSGTFEGLGNTISSLSVISGALNTGFFGNFLGTVRDFGLVNSTVTNTQTNLKAVVFVGALVAVNNGFIIGSYATGSVGQNKGTIGGLVGKNSGSGTISRSYAAVSVSAGLNATPGAGGLVGSNSGTITSSYATGSVVQGAGGNIGGLVGTNLNTITSSYATGAVQNATAGGGLVGNNNGTITSSYATGAVTGSSVGGGLVGANSNTITSSYATGSVTAVFAGFTGGLVASNSGTINNSYWDTQTSGQASSAGGTGLTSDQWLVSGPAATHAAGWDFANTWVAGYPYPVLKVLPYVLVNATGSAAPGNTPSFTINSILDGPGNNAAALVNTSNMAALGASLPAGSYPFGAKNATVAAGYQLTYNGALTLGTFNVTAALQGTVIKTYDGTLLATLGASNYSLAGVAPYDTGSVTLTVNGTPVTSPTTGLFSSKHVGSNLQVTVSGLGLNQHASGYALTATTISANIGTISPALLTISATPDSKTYDGTTSSSATPTYVGLQTGDSLTSLSQAFASRHVLGTGLSTLNVNGSYSLTNSGDYTVSLVSALGTINPATLTIRATSDSKTYDGTTASSATPTVAGTLYDSVTDLAQEFTSKDVGNHGQQTVVTGYNVNDGNNGADYTVLKHAGDGDITPASLTIRAVTDSKIYDGTTNSAATPTVGLLYGSDSVTGLVQAFGFKDVVGTNGSPIYVTDYMVNDGNSGRNYTVALNRAFGTISAALLTIRATTDSKTYDGTTDSFVTPTVDGLVGSDTLTGLSQAFAFRHVLGTDGSTLVVNGGYLLDDGNGGNDYTVSLANAAGTINPATLIIRATPDSKTYDGTTTSFATPTYEGLVAGDGVTDLSQAFVSKDVPQKPKHGHGPGVSLLDVTGYMVNDGNSGNNYAVETQTADGHITPALLTIRATTDSKTYDGTTASSATPTYDGLVGSDTLTGLSQAFTSRNVTTSLNPNSVEVTTYRLEDGNKKGSNYDVNLVAGSGTINPALLTIRATTDSKTYDGTTDSFVTPTVDGLVGSDTLTVTGLSQAFASRHVLGTDRSTLIVKSGYLLDVDDGNGGGNYNVSELSAAGTISPALLTISAKTDSKTYDGTTTSTATPTYLGLVGSDTLTGLGQAFASKDVLGANHSILNMNGGYLVNDGNLGNDYTVSVASALGTISPASLTVTADTQTKVYGASDPTLSYNASGFQFSDTTALLTGALSRASGENVASYAIGQNNLAAGGNYNIAYTGANLAITPATLTVTANAQTKVYGASDPTLSYGVSGLTNSDTASVITGLLARASGENVASYAIGQNNLAAGGNYNIAYTGANLGITPASLTVTADTQSKVYGASDPTLSYNASGFQFSDTTALLTGALSRASGENVASYAIGQNNLAAGGNYNIAYTGANLAITPATLTVTANAQTKVYGASDPTLSYGVSGLTNSDTASVITGLLARASGENVASYAIGQNNLAAGGNYNIAYTGANLGITPASLTISATSQTKTYDGTTTSTATPTYAGLVAADAGNLTGLTQAFASPNVLGPNGSTLLVTGYSLSDPGNYTVTTRTALGTINPAALTVATAGLTGSATKIYDGTATATLTSANYTLNGVLAADLANVLLNNPSTGTFSQSNVGSNLTVTVTGLALLGSAKANYTLASNTISAPIGSITPATLTYVANAASRTYGAANPALLGTVTGFVAAQNQGSATTGALVFATPATTSSSVGSYAVNGAGLTARNGNYIFVQAAGNATALTINPATLTYVANAASRTYGAANPALSGTVTGFVLGQSRGSATTGTLAFATPATASSNVGSYAVNGSGLTARNGNYSFVQAAGNATALTINPATLTYNADIVIRPRNEDNPTLTGTVTGYVLGQTQATATTGTLAFTTPATKSSPIGFYSITGSGLRANNGNYVFVQAPWNPVALFVSPFNIHLVLRPGVNGFRDFDNDHDDDHDDDRGSYRTRIASNDYR